LAAVGAQTIAVNAGSASTATVAPSTKITVPVIVDLTNIGGASIASLSTGVTWASARLTFDSIRVATGLGWTLTSNLANAGTGSISFTVSNATALAVTATVVNLYFTSSAGSGQTRVTLSPTAALNVSQKSVLQLVQPRALDVLVAVDEGKWGDVNNDLSVDIIDAQQIARFTVSLSVLNAAALALRGDVNADAAVNIIDAQQIARFTVALSYVPLINTNLTITPVVASATLAPSAAQNLGIGGTVQEVVTARDAGNADITGSSGFTWSSTNTAVATVNGDGFVTGIAPGTVTVTATSISAPGVTASVTVNVSGTPIIRMSFAHGGRVSHRYIIEVSGTGITSFLGYSVSGTNMTGTTMDVDVPGAGTYTVRVVGLDAAIPPTSPASELFLVGGQMSVVVPGGGGLVSRSLVLTNATFTMTTLPSVVVASALIPVAWTIVDPSGVIDSGSGLFCGTVNSSTSALANDFSGTSTSACSVTLPVAGTMTYAFLAPTTLSAPAVPGTVNLIVRGGNWIRFAQTDSIFVRWINPAISRGDTPLTISVVQVNNVTVTPATPTIGVGATQQMAATARDGSNAVINGLPVTWGSGTPSVATISASGLVTGVANGPTTVTATVGGVQGNTTVTVSGGISVGSITVAPLGPLSGNATTTAVATVLDPSNNVIGAAVQWSSTNPMVARVAADGTVQALGNGTTNIKATIGAVNGQAALTVNQVAQAFTIEVRPLTAMSAGATAAFAAAAARWALVIRGDEPDVVLNNKDVSGCVSGVPNLTETIDDVVIYATVAPIDGVGGILGQAGPCFSRSGSLHAYIGRMTFDAADVASMEANGTLTPVILHEMGHVLGIGTNWSAFLANPAPSNPDPAGDPTFTGPNAQWAFQNLGTGYGGAIVPVENCCGAGTRNSHWRESVLVRELMTGFVSAPGVIDPLSPLTSASLIDIGYVVDVSFSDVQPWFVRIGPPVPSQRIEIKELPMPAPVITDLRGRVLEGGGSTRVPAIRPPPRNP
jgi:hypothetical protein